MAGRTGARNTRKSAEIVIYPLGWRGGVDVKIEGRRQNKRCTREISRRGKVVAAVSGYFAGGKSYTVHKVLLWTEDEGWLLADLPGFDYKKDRDGGGRNYPTYTWLDADEAIFYLQHIQKYMIEVDGLWTVVDMTDEAIESAIRGYGPGPKDSVHRCKWCGSVDALVAPAPSGGEEVVGYMHKPSCRHARRNATVPSTCRVEAWRPRAEAE